MIYIQGPNGLQPISSQLTKENIIAALGYTPADSLMFYEDESGSLIIADEQGYIIARIDENGLTTTQVNAEAIALNGEDLAAKLQELANKVPDIDLSNYYTKGRGVVKRLFVLCHVYLQLFTSECGQSFIYY